jgi:hypothetical protein
MGLLVVGLGVLTVMELGTPSRTTGKAPDPFEQIKFDTRVSGDTLRKGDRLEIHHSQHEMPAEPISPVEPARPTDVTNLVPKSNAVARGTNGKTDAIRKPKPKYAAPDSPQPKPANSNKTATTDRPKAIVEVKPCRPNAFDSLLQALNLSSRCQT